MSCSVIILPLEIAVLVSSMTAGVVTGVASNIHSQNTLANNEDNEVFYIQQNVCVEKKFDTIFVSKDLLIKTLVEQGFEIQEDNDYSLKASISNYVFEFDRDDLNTPYSLLVKCNQESDVENTIKNLNSDYQLNVQEKSYLNVINKLEENNMQIESEEVLEDNTVVLTINIE